MLRNDDPLRNPEALIDRVYSYVAYRIGGGAEAEDVTGETFERAVRYRHTYDSDHGTPLAWVLGIARRCTNDALTSRRQNQVELTDAQAPGNLEAEAVDRLELESALAQLAPADVELLSLRYGADLSAKQIAEALDSTPGAVRVGLHRAHGRLRAILEDGRREPTTEVRVQIQPAP
jgi:RNA polymerase sigma-70 factor (ECF subfamily)